MSKVFDTTQVNRHEIEEYVVESVVAGGFSSSEILASVGNSTDAAADIVAESWLELYPDELPVDQDGDPLDIRRYASGYFERLVEQAD